MIDVKLTETHLPWFFRIGAMDFINAHARVEVEQRVLVELRHGGGLGGAEHLELGSAHARHGDHGPPPPPSVPEASRGRAGRASGRPDRTLADP